MSSENKQMQPVSRREATLNDLLDRLLTKGIMLHADVVLTVSGIPLLGLNLRLALAGMSTMLRYGFMTDWDEAIRSTAQKEDAGEGPNLDKGERVLITKFGSCWYSRGIYSAWRPGMIYLTDRRLLLYQQTPAEMLLDLSLRLINDMDVRQVPHFSGQERQELWLTLTSGDVLRLHSNDGAQLLAALEKSRSLAGTKSNDLVQTDSGKTIYYLAPNRTGGHDWRRGVFCVKDGGLCWQGRSGQGMSFHVAATDVRAVRFIAADTMSCPDGGPVMEVHYLGRHNPEKAYFAGEIEALRPWASLLREARSDVLETCPSCGAPAPAGRLLDKGCASCGWLSARLKRRLP